MKTPVGVLLLLATALLLLPALRGSGGRARVVEQHAKIHGRPALQLAGQRVRS